jgi:hypothetical protein
MALTPPDTTENTQVNPAHPGGRTIYNASYSEIAAKSFLAGLALGMGKTVASLFFWGVVFVLSVQLLQPLLEPFLVQLQEYSDLLQQFR